MFRRLLLALGAATSVLLLALAASLAPPSSRAARGFAYDSEGGRELLLALDRRVPELKFERMGLARALDSLHEASNLPIAVNWEALGAAGVSRETPVTVRLFNVRASKALQVILSSIEHVKVSYTLGPDRVSVRTEADYIAHTTVVRAYDIRDPIADASERPDDRAGRMGASVAQDVLKLIEETVAPDSWGRSRGKPGFIIEMAGRIVVTQTEENHRQIANVLEQVREHRRQRPARPDGPHPR